MASEDSRALSDPRSGACRGPAGAGRRPQHRPDPGGPVPGGPAPRSVVPETRLPAPFPTHHQDAETLIYILAFALLVPVGVVIAARIADRIAAGPNAAAFSGWSGAERGLALVVVLTRVSTELLGWRAGGARRGGGPLVRAGGVLLARAASARPWRRAPARHRSSAVGDRGLLLAALVLSFTHLEAISLPAPAGRGHRVAAVLVVRERARLPTAPSWLGRTLDVGLVVLLLLAVPNLVVAGCPDVAGAGPHPVPPELLPGPRQPDPRGRRHVGGRLSQYGVGSIYFLAGAFLLLPIGNGTLGLVEGRSRR